MDSLAIIGAGLAGSEAAWQAAQAGIKVDLYEMRPDAMPPAHHTGLFAELVCSNSLRAASIENAVGLLKEEMRRLDSIIIKAADANKVPAGGALAVDREGFSRYVTQTLLRHPNIRVIQQEIRSIEIGRPLIIASGPLTSPALSEQLAQLTGCDYLYFYDAAAPLVTVESLNKEKIFRASRYGKGEDDYLNCPMNQGEYDRFWQELTHAETTAVKNFERPVFFEGCMPVEELAARGRDTLRFGPLKPVGLTLPGTGKLPHAVVQLRQDNAAGTLFNMVGFQTHLKWAEQKRVFRLIPGLENAEFVRYGVMHRNTYINSPRVLQPTMQMRNHPLILFAGQITGVEGYVESASSGLVAGINAARISKGMQPIIFPPETAHGALCRYVTQAEPDHFQPMNINFGLFTPLEARIKDKKLRNQAFGNRSLTALQKFIEKFDNVIA